MTAVWRMSLVVTTAAVTAAAALGGCQRSEASPPPISAPMYVVNNRPTINAQVLTDDGQIRPVRLLLDTGSTGIRFTAAAAKRAGLEPGERTRRADGLFATVDLNALRVGKTRLEVGGVESVVALGETPRLSGVDGSIGADVLRRYGRVTMNFPSERIVLGESDAAPIVGALVPTRFDEGIFTARVTLGDRTRRLVVDTGTVTTRVREDVPIRITGTRQGVWGRTVLAPFEVVSDPQFVASGDGLLGGNLLQRFTLRIDYDLGTLRVSTT